jgi:hypothetical protein
MPLSDAEFMQLIRDQLGVIPGIDEFFSLYHYQSPSLAVLIRKPWFPDLEELRTTLGLKSEDISEKTIREIGGFPGRYPYEAPSGVQYEKAENMAEIFSEETLTYFLGVNMPGFRSDRDLQISEISCIPIEVRLLFFPDRFLGCPRDAAGTARRLYGIMAPTRNRFSLTPSPDRATAPTGVSSPPQTPVRVRRNVDQSALSPEENELADQD